MTPLKPTTHYEERLEHDLELIRSKVKEMAQLDERALLDAIESFVKGNLTMAYSVILRDQFIDEKEKELDRLCLEFIVRQQPVARHLRFVYSTIKINLELERIGDYAESVARQVVKLNSLPHPDTENFVKLANTSVTMLRNAVEAFVAQSPDLARAAMESEDLTDALRREIDAGLMKLRETNQIPLEALTPLLTISRRFERVADQAKNICEEVLYVATGENMKHKGAEAFRVLFVDENNSCRSQMAEAIGNSLDHQNFVFASAGLSARPIDWRAVEFLGEKGIDIAHQASKSVEHVPNLDHYHVIIALAKEAKKIFPPPPTKTVALDWNVEDPSKRPGSLSEVRDAYEQTFQYINTHVRELVNALSVQNLNNTKQDQA
jgi:phosphate transport system protein